METVIRQWKSNEGGVQITCRTPRYRSRRFGAGLAIAVLFCGGCVELRVPDPRVRYIAFGDSSTAGSTDGAYPEILITLLGEESEVMASEGRGGETSEVGLERLTQLLSDQIYPNAEVILYWEGGNDMTEFIKDRDPLLLISPDDPDYARTDELEQRLEQIEANVEAAIVASQQAGLRVFVGTYFFLREDVAECGALPLDIILPAQARNANDYLARVNEVIRSAALRQGAAVVDIAAHGTIEQDAANYVDCNHLSEKGNAMVAGLFYQALEAAGF